MGKFVKGDPRAGRPPGTRDKIPTRVKEMIEGALLELGGQDWLVAQARRHPKAFMALIAKILPRDVSVGVAGTLEQLIAASMQPEKDVTPRIEERAENPRIPVQ